MSSENNNYVVHSNELYDVYCAEFPAPLRRGGYDYAAGYEVVHRNTGMVECRTTSLPDAIFTAEQSNTILVKEQWKWVGTDTVLQDDFEVEGINPDGSPIGA